jgi:hypothetical protein
MRITEPGFHEEVFGLNGQGHRDCEAVGWVCFGEVEGLQKRCGGEDSFLPGEGSADAGSRAIALERKSGYEPCDSLPCQLIISSAYERFPGVGRQSVEGFFVHALGAESLGVWTVYLQGEKENISNGGIQHLPRTAFI